MYLSKNNYFVSSFAHCPGLDHGARIRQQFESFFCEFRKLAVSQKYQSLYYSIQNSSATKRQYNDDHRKKSTGRTMLMSILETN